MIRRLLLQYLNELQKVEESKAGDYQVSMLNISDSDLQQMMVEVEMTFDTESLEVFKAIQQPFIDSVKPDIEEIIVNRLSRERVESALQSNEVSLDKKIELILAGLHTSEDPLVDYLNYNDPFYDIDLLEDLDKPTASTPQPYIYDPYKVNYMPING